jgi:Carboxypeptidase regulatory-like domain
LSALKSVEVAGDQEVTFDIATGGIRGRISSSEAGSPIAGAFFRLEGAAISDLPVPVLQRTSDGSGAFEISGISAGAYKITVERQGFAPATLNVEVLPGAVAPVEIELKPLQ